MTDELGKILDEIGVSPEHIYVHLILMALVQLLVFAAVAVGVRDGRAASGNGTGGKGEFRRIVSKYGGYWHILVLGCFADFIALFFPFYTLPYVSIIIGLCIIFIEGRGMAERAKKRKDGVSQIPGTLEKIARIAVDAGLGDTVAEKAREVAGEAMEQIGSGASGPKNNTGDVDETGKRQTP